MENVIVVTFDIPERSSQALDELRRLSDEEAVGLRSAVVVQRLADGRFVIPDEAGGGGFTGTAVGGVLGAVVGTRAGPLGILFGGAVGVAVGSLSDTDEAERTETLLATASRGIVPGATALVADVNEPAPEVLDAVMERLGGRLRRWSRWDVEGELAAADAAIRAAQSEADRVLRERRKAERRETLRDRLDELKERVTGGP